MLVYDRELCSKSSITADTAFRKDLTLQGCTKVSTRTSTLFARSVNIHPSVCRRGLSHDVSQTQSKYMGATPLSYPQRSRPVFETDSGFASMAVNDWEPESVTGLVDTAKTLRIQNSTGAPRTILNKAVKHGIST